MNILSELIPKSNGAGIKKGGVHLAGAPNLFLFFTFLVDPALTFNQVGDSRDLGVFAVVGVECRP